jgi:hypothetical protein
MASYKVTVQERAKRARVRSSFVAFVALPFFALALLALDVVCDKKQSII